MKTKLHILLIINILLFNIVVGQNIIPNGDFSNTTSGWNIVGNNLSLTTNNPNPLAPHNGSGMYIYNSGSTGEDFILTSPSFSLIAGERYKLELIYGNYGFDSFFFSVWTSRISI